MLVLELRQKLMLPISENDEAQWLGQFIFLHISMIKLRKSQNINTTPVRKSHSKSHNRLLLCVFVLSNYTLQHPHRDGRLITRGVRKTKDRFRFSFKFRLGFNTRSPASAGIANRPLVFVTFRCRNIAKKTQIPLRISVKRQRIEADPIPHYCIHE